MVCRLSKSIIVPKQYLEFKINCLKLLGRMVIFLWSTFSLLIILFYQCNLGALLVAVEFEKPIDTSADVVQRGQAVYLNFVLHSYFKALAYVCQLKTQETLNTGQTIKILFSYTVTVKK